jgi:hypothetical protein
MKKQHFPVVIVTGMHRSGTSCLTGSLQQKGLYLGEVFEQSKYNLKGNRENKLIMSLNDSVLKSSGGSWDNPPSDIKWTAEEAQKRDEIISSFSTDSKQWGFKDPRALFTLPFWQEGIAHIQLIASLRQPLLVAQSLHKRAVSLGYGDKMTVDKGLELWLAYNKQLLVYVKNERFPIISFDQPLPEYLSCIDSLSDELGLVGDSPNEDPFIEPTLINQKIQADAMNRVPSEMLTLYDELKEFCV